MRALSSLSYDLRSRQLRRKQPDPRVTLQRAIARLSRASAPSTYSTLWPDAIYGWGNAKWSAEELYLAEVVRTAESATSSILECGSGLTTLLVGAVAARRGLQLHSLEHNHEWHERVTKALRDFGIGNVTVHLAPLRSFPTYDWYDAPLQSMPSDFSYVVCDGPPASTRGGRSGVLPTMRGKFSPVCTVLLDDANNPNERALVESWVRDLDATAEIRPSNRGFARAIVRGA